MKKTFLLLMAMLTTLVTEAQVKPTVLGDRHAMLKVKQGERYLLLPVQESEDIAAIAVLNGRNDMVQRMNVKLAIDRVDYYVRCWTSSFTATDARRVPWASLCAGRR